MELEAKPFWRDAPSLPESLERIYKAFWDLSGSRSQGPSGSGTISFSVVDRYAKRFGIEDFEEFWSLIRAMDKVFLDHAHRQRGGK